ncbi:hypothetical protein [Paenibacillus alvei]|nr:hypothetical protein [Paenibacillus alvei]NEZ45551.1 hypothetical protein [Paenibacillus alvei]
MKVEDVSTRDMSNLIMGLGLTVAEVQECIAFFNSQTFVNLNREDEQCE